MMSPPHLHKSFEQLLRALAAQHGVWIVGGWVRDSLLGLEPHDADFATNATRDAIEAAAGSEGISIIVDAVAQAHGIYRLHAKGSQAILDLAMLRTDAKRLGVRHAQVVHTSSIEEDLSRRDLTINAMAVPYPLAAAGAQVIDPFAGQQDSAAKHLRFVGRAAERLEEDPLRLLRLARFACLGEAWTIAPDTCRALPAAAPKLARVAPERLRDETLRAMAMASPARFWQVVGRAHAQAMLLPDTPADRPTSLPAAIVWLRHAASLSPHVPTRLTAFFVGLTIPLTEEASGHWQGAYVREAMHRLRCSKALTQEVAHAVQLFPKQPHRLVGEPLAQWLIDLGESAYTLLDPALLLAERLGLPCAPAYQALRLRVHAMVGAGPWPALRHLALSGQDLMRLLKLDAGPGVGRRLQALLLWATANGCLTHKDKLLQHLGVSMLPG